MGQSSNDTFPTAMHIAAVPGRPRAPAPQCSGAAAGDRGKARQWQDVVKIGRTHLEDAVPLTVGQEWSGYAAPARPRPPSVSPHPLTGCTNSAGGTAVGTGLNAPPSFAEAIAAEIAELTGQPFRTAANKFAAQGGLDAMVGASAGLRALAVPLMKIANDIRWLALGPPVRDRRADPSGERAGQLDHAGQGQPTQCEAMVMVCIQVLSEDGAIAFAGLAGQLRAQRDAAGHHQQLPALRHDSGRCLRQVAPVLHRGHRTQP